MSDSWNVPNRSNNCSISILTEKINAIFPLYHCIFFQPFPIFSSNVHNCKRPFHLQKWCLMYKSNVHIPYSIQPFINSTECLKQNDYDADGVIEDCIFDVKTFGITLPNINRLQEKLNKLCPKEYSAYYITISGNLDIANDILTKLLSKVPEPITKVFNEQNKTCTDFIYKLPEYQLELRAHNTSKTNIMSSISEFNPYKWAMENQFYFFHHASQFCVDKPYIIICPYDSKTAKHFASGSPESFGSSLRALCRRMFMGMPEDKYISMYDFCYAKSLLCC